MNENINLTKILKDCPKGWKFYSSIYGEVIFETIEFQCLKHRYNSYMPTWNHQIVKEDPRPIKFTVQDIEHCVSSAGEHIKGKGECTFFPSKEQRDWSKFTAPWYNKESIKPKFKVGDRIRHKETNKDDVYEISKVYDDSYGIVGFNWGIYMKYQDQYELVPNKFNPKTLKSFDRILVRKNNDYDWSCDFFSHLRNQKCYTITYSTFSQTIPYNDETKHLVGTKEEAPEYYRYWEN